MINRFITWLRRDDDRLEPLRREIQQQERQQERQMDWDDLQTICLYVIYMMIIMGTGLIFAFWIMA